MVGKKVISYFSVLVLFLLLNVNTSYAQNNEVVNNKDNKTEDKTQNNVSKKYSLMEDKSDLWVLFSFMGVGETNYVLSGDYSVSKSSTMNYSGTFGGDVWKFFGVELTLAGRVGNVEYNKNLLKNKKEYTSFDVLVHLMFIPKINITNQFDIRPYVGIGPSFHYVTMDHEVENISTKYISALDIGGSFKAGVRFQVVKYFTVGLGIEYIIHESSITDSLGEKEDLSGLKGGLEIGVSF